MLEKHPIDSKRRKVLQGIGAGVGFMTMADIAQAEEPSPESMCTTNTLVDHEDDVCLHCDNRNVGGLSSVELILTVDPTPSEDIGTLKATDGSEKISCPLDASEWSETIDSGYESIYISNPQQYLNWQLEIDDDQEWSHTLEIEECM